MTLWNKYRRIGTLSQELLSRIHPQIVIFPTWWSQIRNRVSRMKWSRLAHAQSRRTGRTPRLLVRNTPPASTLPDAPSGSSLLADPTSAVVVPVKAATKRKLGHQWNQPRVCCKVCFPDPPEAVVQKQHNDTLPHKGYPDVKNPFVITGPTSMQKKDVVILLHKGETSMVFPGREGYKIEWSAGTQIVPLVSVSPGHLVIPDGEFKTSSTVFTTNLSREAPVKEGCRRPDFLTIESVQDACFDCGNLRGWGLTDWQKPCSCGNQMCWNCYQESCSDCRKGQRRRDAKC